jgi:hypothetical protein
MGDLAHAAGDSVQEYGNCLFGHDRLAFIKHCTVLPVYSRRAGIVAAPVCLVKVPLQKYVFRAFRFRATLGPRTEFSFDNALRTMNNTPSIGWFGRSGGTGRRAGFKIPSWQQGEGSTPSFGNSSILAAAYCPLPARLPYSSSFQPEGKIAAAKTIFSRSPGTKGYSPTVRTLLPAPIRQQSQNSPHA